MGRRIVGIDTGINGGAAAIEVVAGPSFSPYLKVIDIMDLPTVGEGPSRIINATALQQWLGQIGPQSVAIEHVFAMPSQADKGGHRRGMGAASAFRFGEAKGALRATVACCGLPLVMVVPTVWKKHFGLKGPDKERSRLYALNRVPSASRWLQRKMDHGRAEALLLAVYHAEKTIQ